MVRNREAGGLFGKDGFGFDDLVDVVNPLQHIPVVSTFYRAMTQDRLAPAPRLLGGALLGGVVGLAVAALNAVLEGATGKDVGEHVRTALFGGADAPEEPVMMAGTAAEAAQVAAVAPHGEMTKHVAESPGPEEAEEDDSRPGPSVSRRTAHAGAPGPWYLAGRSARRIDEGPSTPQQRGAEPAPPPVRVAHAGVPWYLSGPSAPRVGAAASPPTRSTDQDAPPAATNAVALAAPPPVSNAVALAASPPVSNAVALAASPPVSNAVALPAWPSAASDRAPADPAAPEGEAAAQTLPRLSSAQIELLLASVGKTGAADRILTEQGRSGQGSAVTPQAGASASVPPSGAGAGAPTREPIAERMMDALDKYQNVHGLYDQARRRVDVVR
jgi:hypothetical protein